MNKIWLSIIVISLVFGLATGRSEEMVEGIMNVPNDAIGTLIKIGGLLIVYNGIFQIAVDSSLIYKISKPFRKIVVKIFNEVDASSKAIDYICCNIVANMLGLGLASTPTALKALNELKKEGKMNRSIITFLLLNISCFTVLPLTALGIRELYNAKISVKLVLFLILISGITSIFAIFIGSLLGKKNE